MCSPPQTPTPATFSALSCSLCSSRLLCCLVLCVTVDARALRPKNYMQMNGIIWNNVCIFAEKKKNKNIVNLPLASHTTRASFIPSAVMARGLLLLIPAYLVYLSTIACVSERLPFAYSRYYTTVYTKSGEAGSGWKI